MYYFYCPNCRFEKELSRLPKGTIGNPRDGWGIPIHHFECEKCHNLDAGFMLERYKDFEEKEYYRSIIKKYQGIRGIKESDR